MYGLKLYMTFEDINNYIRTKVDPKYKNTAFIPICAEVNTTDLSVEVSLVEATSLEGCDERRFKLELSTQCDKGNGIKLRPIDEVFNPCSECAHEDWDMPQCKDCNIENGFKHFEGWENV